MAPPRYCFAALCVVIPIIFFKTLGTTALAPVASAAGTHAGAVFAPIIAAGRVTII